MAETTDAPFMLKIRVEGNFVNCYVAPHGLTPASMGLHLIGTVHRRVMESDPGLFIAWKELMKRVLVIAVKQSIGLDLDMDKMREEIGPESERAPDGSGH